jgi:transposase
MDDHFHALMNTYDYESALFRIDSKLRAYRELKEKYITFNFRNAGNPSEARKEMQTLIQEYQKSEYDIFREFASLLVKFEDPIESINRKVKDLKRLGRGFRNFEHLRNRFLYTMRSSPVLNAVNDYNTC